MAQFPAPLLNWLVWLVVGLGLGCCRPCQAEFIPLRVKAALIDSSGTVWAVALQEKFSALFKFHAGTWIEEDRPPGLDGRYEAHSLALGPQDEVYCIWWAFLGDERAFAVTRHHRDTSTFVVEHRGPKYTFLSDSPAGAAVDGAGNLWLLADTTPFIYQVLLGESQVREHRLADEFYQGRPRYYFAPGVPQVASSALLVDPRGRVWLRCIEEAERGPAINGVVIIDRGGFKHLPWFKGLGWSRGPVRLSSLEILDLQHLVAALRGRGLYVIDLDTLAAKSLPAGPAEGLSSIRDVYPAADGIWFTSDILPKECCGVRKGSNGLYRALHRLSGDQLQLIQAGLDVQNWDRGRRGFLQDEQGVWLGSYGGGVWLFGADDRTQRLNWQDGESLSFAEWIFRLPSNELLFIERDRGVSILPPNRMGTTSHGLKGWEPPVFFTFQPETEPVQDPKGNIWYPAPGGCPALRRWDGREFQEFLLAKRDASGCYVAVAAASQIWAITLGGGETFLADAAVDMVFQRFDTFRSALQETAARRGAFPVLHTSGGAYQTAVAPGRVAYFDWRGELNLFADGRWQVWKSPERPFSSKAMGGLTLSFDGPAGRLLIHSGQECQALGSAGAWEPLDCPETSTSSYSTAIGGPEPPVCLGQSGSQAPVYDGSGRWWFNPDRRLVVASQGYCSDYLPAGVKHPFLDGRKPLAVYYDPLGNPVFKTDFFGSHPEFVVVAERLAAPVIRLKTFAVAEDAVSLEAAAEGAGPFVFEVRLDDGEWSEPKPISAWTFRWLKTGAHLIRVRARDRLLRASPELEHEFQVTVSPDEQWQRFIAALFSDDEYQRNDALAHVAGVPAAAERLHAMRSHSSPGQRWWIDVALQELDATRNNAPGR